MSNFEYVLPVIRGIQARGEYYVSMCPLRLLAKLFPVHKEMDPCKRSQRVINQSRVNKISQYVLNNPKYYFFSAITASIDADVIFEPVGKLEQEWKMGRLRIPMEGEITIQDGLHRRLGLEMAYKMNPDLGSETIAVILFVDIGIERCQQMFRDLNCWGVRPSASLNILYDHRDPVAEVTRMIMERVPRLRCLTNLEKDSLSKGSQDKYTLNGVYQETVFLLSQHQGKSLEEQVAIAVQYWLDITSSQQ